MYISVEQSLQLDSIVKSFEVALRTFVAETLINSYPNKSLFKAKVCSISLSNETIHAQRFRAKIGGIKANADGIYETLTDCLKSKSLKTYNNQVLYTSETIELILILFNSDFEKKDISKGFSSIEEFHYCCHLYHTIRNYLSHPASKPTPISDANKVIAFIENINSNLNEDYYWYVKRSEILLQITKYRGIQNKTTIQYSNLAHVSFNHKSLLCRDTVITQIYESLMGDGGRKRLAGSIVLYGYGGVGKTAITIEFLYRIIRDKADGKYSDIEYTLFFSSKDEYLRENNTTGELYIDSARPEFSTLEELQGLICKNLKLGSINSLDSSTKKGIIAIDNIENISQIEKERIIKFIKSLPRNVQFIVTSRNEEPCEEKIHVAEFIDDEVGDKFINELIETQALDIDTTSIDTKKIIDVSKGNALIIIQVLNIIARRVSSINEIILSLENIKSKNTEMIASFMYKNTFDSAINNLEGRNLPAKYVIQIISLYDENIELYSISKLAKIDVSDAEKLCNHLLERLIITKSGEYYQLNDFAKKFVFIKLLPDRFELNKIKDKIRQHKERMKKKLDELDYTLKKEKRLRDIVLEWQPRNYIDKIVIAESFSLYGEAIKYVSSRDKSNFEKCLKNFDDHIFITRHPYVPLQKARLLKEGIRKIYNNDDTIVKQVEHLYEEAIESIEYECRHLLGTGAHASLLMYFGVFLAERMRQHSRAIRFLEGSKIHYGSTVSKGWFITCNYLTKSYKVMYQNTKDGAYKDQLVKLVKEVISKKLDAKSNGFDIDAYIQNYSKLLSI